MDLQDNRQNDQVILYNNGRLFPTWIMHNFKKYVLPDIIRKEGEDPCNESISKDLTNYQKFVAAYLSYTSPYKDILLYHGLGSGKTITAINIYSTLYNYTPKWNLILIIPAALEKDPWLKEINAWMEKDNNKDKFKNLKIIHYDSPFADRDFLQVMRSVDVSNPTIFIIEEAHRFINNVYNNFSSKKGKRALVIYDYIQQEKREKPSMTRIMLLSATPVVNKPFEFALIFNLLRPDSFPTSESMFSQVYISSTNYVTLNENSKNMFQRRILGLVSYYLGATPDKYATKTVHYKNILMGEYQEEVYNYLEEQEEKKEKMMQRMSRGKVGDEMSTYKSYTRQACNFVFPNISNKINGEMRPRPGMFKIKEYDAAVIDEGKDAEKKSSLVKKKEVGDYVKAINEYISRLVEYLKDIHRDDIKKKYNLSDDVKTFIKKYKSKFTEFLKNEKKKSKLFEKLYECSPKMVTAIFNIIKSKGPTLLYSNYVETEGLQVFKIYLSFFGFMDLANEKSKDVKYDYNRYVEYHGSVDREQRDKNKIMFNDKDNIYGKIAKVILISPAGAEGINLYNVRQVHILEPFWNEARIEQVIGRAIRICHHAALPMEERQVDVFRYKMVRKSGKETADEELENLSRKKNNLLLSFIEAVKEASVDCELFKSHNTMGSQYKCFQFNEESLFEDPIGPAYNTRLEYDQKINNGLNSKDSTVMKIKVKKIKAIKKISENMYSESADYWYYKESGVVYDYELNYPVGKVEKDDMGNELKVGDNYVIGQLINIPEFKQYSL